MILESAERWWKGFDRVAVAAVMKVAKERSPERDLNKYST